MKGSRKRGRPPVPVSRTVTVSCAVEPEFADRLKEGAERSEAKFSAYLRDVLTLATSIEIADLRQVIAYAKTVRDATEAAGDDPENWQRYARVVPFPNFDIAAASRQLAELQTDFRNDAADAVRKAVDTELQRHVRVIRKLGEPEYATEGDEPKDRNGFLLVASPDLKQALSDAGRRHSARRFLEISKRRERLAKAQRKES